jgi:hypothetical protein
MIEQILKTKANRDFLRQYNSQVYKYIIPLLVEFGILFLKQNFNIANLSVEDMKEVIMNLRETFDNNETKERGRTNSNIQNEEKLNNEIRRQETGNKIYSRSKSASSQQMRKPSSDWRNGDRTQFNNKINSLQEMKKIYRDSSVSPNNDPNLQRERSPSLNPNIYPIWWGNQSSDDEFKKSFEKPADEFQPDNTEVYFHRYKDEDLIDRRIHTKKKNKTYQRAWTSEISLPGKGKSRSRSKSRPRPIHITPSNNKVNELYSNLKYVESKIRPQVVYDKRIYEGTNSNVPVNKTQPQYNSQHRANPDQNPCFNRADSYQEWTYENHIKGINQNQTHVQESNRSTMRDKEVNNTKSSIQKKGKVNYMISYDKDLRPEVVKEKTKEVPLPPSNRTRTANLRKEKENLPTQNNITQHVPTHQTQNTHMNPNMNPNMMNQNNSQSNFATHGDSYRDMPKKYSDSVRNSAKNSNGSSRNQPLVNFNEHPAMNNIYTGAINYANHPTSNNEKHETANFTKQEELSFKKRSEHEEEGEEQLSSYAPSERTKGNMK